MYFPIVYQNDRFNTPIGVFVSVLVLHDLGLLNMPDFVFREDSFLNLFFSVGLFSLLIHAIKTERLFWLVAVIGTLWMFPFERPRLLDIFSIISSLPMIIVSFSFLPMWIFNSNMSVKPEYEDFCTVFLLTDMFSLSNTHTKLWINTHMYAPVMNFLEWVLSSTAKNLVVFVQEATKVVLKLFLIMCLIVVVNSQLR